MTDLDPKGKSVKITFFVLLSLFCPLGAQATSPEDYYNAGLDLMKQKDYEKAVQYFRAAVDQRPDYWQAYQFLGEAYYQDANRTEAVVAMRESLRLHPRNPDLEKFMERIKRDSPWVSNGTWREFSPILAIVISVLTLAWTIYAPRHSRPERKP